MGPLERAMQSTHDHPRLRLVEFCLYCHRPFFFVVVVVFVFLLRHPTKSIPFMSARLMSFLFKQLHCPIGISPMGSSGRLSHAALSLKFGPRGACSRLARNKTEMPLVRVAITEKRQL